MWQNYSKGHLHWSFDFEAGAESTQKSQKRILNERGARGTIEKSGTRQPTAPCMQIHLAYLLLPIHPPHCAFTFVCKQHVRLRFFLFYSSPRSCKWTSSAYLPAIKRQQCIQSQAAEFAHSFFNPLGSKHR